MIEDLLKLIDRYPSQFSIVLAMGYALGAFFSFLLSKIQGKHDKRPD